MSAALITQYEEHLALVRNLSDNSIRGYVTDLESFLKHMEKMGIVEFNQLEIEHIHYRQGEKKADFDTTYADIYKASDSWRPKITYKKLKRERWIDIILLCEKGEIKIPFDYSHILSSYLYKIIKKRISVTKRRRLLTMTNSEIIWSLFTLFYKKTRESLKR